mgnify:CR=1 FL=1
MVKRVALIGVLLALALLLGLWLASRSGKQPAVGNGVTTGEADERRATGVVVTAIAAPTGRQPGQTPLLLGEKILRDYAKASLPPENDLTLMAHLFDNFTLLVKSAASRPLSANEDWAAALRGQNPARERFLPNHHVALNADGKLVDRWGTPLFFHALGGGRFEIRSAGPDGKLWTADDLHRNADGTFRRGAELNSSSLDRKSTRLNSSHRT